VHEFSRDYIGSLNRPYQKEDVLYCIKMQLDEEKKLADKGLKLILTDNEVINGKVWMLDKYGECPQWIENEIKKNPYDLYLLTYPDIDFIEDNVRENKNRRMFFYDWYKKELESHSCNFKIIKGNRGERFKNTLNLTDSFLEKYR
jgi:nicotinamide riboside kinase